MSIEEHRWKKDPAKWAACGRLEELGAAIGTIDDEHEHVEIMQRSDGTPVDDGDIPGIVESMNILADATTLDLSNSAITDDSGVHLRQLRTVTALYLSGVQLSDASIPHLAAIPNLRELALSGTAVTDTGLAGLANLKTLEFLQLYSTNVTDIGIDCLKQSLPQLNIEW